MTISSEVLTWLTDFTHIKQTRTCTDYEAGLVKAGDTAGVVIRLPVQEMCADVGQIDHRGQTGVPGTHFKRTDLLHVCEG